MTDLTVNAGDEVEGIALRIDPDDTIDHQEDVYESDETKTLEDDEVDEETQKKRERRREERKRKEANRREVDEAKEEARRAKAEADETRRILAEMQRESLSQINALRQQIERLNGDMTSRQVAAANDELANIRKQIVQEEKFYANLLNEDVDEETLLDTRNSIEKKKQAEARLIAAMGDNVSEKNVERFTDEQLKKKNADQWFQSNPWYRDPQNKWIADQANVFSDKIEKNLGIPMSDARHFVVLNDMLLDFYKKTTEDRKKGLDKPEKEVKDVNKDDGAVSDKAPKRSPATAGGTTASSSSRKNTYFGQTFEADTIAHLKAEGALYPNGEVKDRAAVKKIADALKYVNR